MNHLLVKVFIIFIKGWFQYMEELTMSNQKTILVTGATGQQGGAVTRELLKKGYHVSAMTRNPESERANALTKLGAKVVQGNLDDVASLEHAIQGVWGIFAVQNTWEAGVEQEEVQGKRIAEIAKKLGVQQLILKDGMD